MLKKGEKKSIKHRYIEKRIKILEKTKKDIEKERKEKLKITSHKLYNMKQFQKFQNVPKTIKHETVKTSPICIYIYTYRKNSRIFQQKYITTLQYFSLKTFETNKRTKNE